MKIYVHAVVIIELVSHDNTWGGGQDLYLTQGKSPQLPRDDDVDVAALHPSALERLFDSNVGDERTSGDIADGRAVSWSGY